MRSCVAILFSLVTALASHIASAAGDDLGVVLLHGRARQPPRPHLGYCLARQRHLRAVDGVGNPVELVRGGGHAVTVRAPKPHQKR